MATKKASSTGVVDPFAVAVKKTPGGKKASSGVIVAEDFRDAAGKLISSKDDIVSAIEGYVEGATLFDQGKAMKDTHRPTLLRFARSRFCQDWLMQGKRPSSPMLTTAESGDGTFLRVVFMDSVNKLDESSYNLLATCLGSTDICDKHVTKRTDFLINPELLEEVVDVKGKDGKVEKQTVLQALKDAIMEKFAPSPNILAGLFQAIPVFQTQKGLIDKGLQLVCPDKSPTSAVRLAEFLEKGRFTTQLKPGVAGKGED